MNSTSIVIEKTYNAPVAAVWTAITNKEDIKRWSFDIADFNPKVGFEFKFLGGPAEKQYLHLCKITEVIPEKKLTYSWRYDGYEGLSFVTFELSKEGAKTRIRLTHAGVESFPKENPDLAKKNFIQGWTDIIGRSLKEFVEKK